MAFGKLETQLDEWLDKKAPFKLPANGRKSLAHALWWIALIVGVLDLWAAFMFWHAGHLVDRLVDYSNSLAAAVGAPTYATPHLGLFYYLTVLSITVVGVVMLLATPHLKAMKKAGWNLLFYALLVQVLVAVFRMFSDVGGGLGNFVVSLFWAVVGAYFLFQVRDNFTGAASAKDTASHADKK